MFRSLLLRTVDVRSDHRWSYYVCSLINLVENVVLSGETKNWFIRSCEITIRNTQKMSVKDAESQKVD